MAWSFIIGFSLGAGGPGCGGCTAVRTWCIWHGTSRGAAQADGQLSPCQSSTLVLTGGLRLQDGTPHLPVPTLGHSMSPPSHSLVRKHAFSKSMEGQKGRGASSLWIQGLPCTSPSALPSGPGQGLKRPWLHFGVGKASGDGLELPSGTLGVVREVSIQGEKKRWQRSRTRQMMEQGAGTSPSPSPAWPAPDPQALRMVITART